VVDVTTGDAVQGALVTLRASEYNTTSNEEGKFTLNVPPQEGEFEITAWAPGYYIGFVTTTLSTETLQIDLRKHHSIDHKDYIWLDPTPDENSSTACGNCHPAVLPQWQGNAHGGSIANPRFFSQYNGTTIEGDPIQGPGYLLDFPETAGSCANCHAPGASANNPFTTDMNAQREVLTAGIHCDFCHKVGGQYLQPQSGLTYPNAPGVLSMRLLRPPEGEQIFIGPFPDIHDPDTYSPEMKESAFCAPCHQFSFWGTMIYNSYGEWLASQYATDGITCQDCHMLPNGDSMYALAEVGGLSHPPETIPSHLQLGINNENFMRDALSLEFEVSRESSTLTVDVTVTNTGAGHHYPTDHPGRHLILVVQGWTGEGEPLALAEGSTIPDWGGEYAGAPGKAFALILKDVQSGDSPVVSYWKQALVVRDTRIPALANDSSTFTFQVEEGKALVEVKLIFRRLFQPIAEMYGWDVSEIVLTDEEIILEQ
jgi:hypothetical protein